MTNDEVEPFLRSQGVTRHYTLRLLILYDLGTQVSLNFLLYSELTNLGPNEISN